MKTINIIRQASVLLTLGLICTGALFAQGDGKGKNLHNEKRYVTRHGKDSTVTIMTEDISNGQTLRKTLVIHNGDTTTNMVVEKTSNGQGKTSSVIIDGDTIANIKKLKINTGDSKHQLVIVNGDTLFTNIGPDNIDIKIDTAAIRQKISGNKALADATKKGFSMNDKYIIVNMDKFKKDSLKEKRHNVVGKIGIEGFDLGFTQFVDHNNIGVNAENSMLDLKVNKSTNVNFRVADLKVNLIDYKLYLDAGLEFDLHDYMFSNAITLKNTDSFSFDKPGSITYNKNKLATQYLEVPVMLCFNSNPDRQDRSFSLGVGGYYGIMLGAYTKQLSDARGLQRIYGNFNCNSIDYGVEAEIGYGHVSLFGKYNMSSIFRTDKGAPDLQTVTFGIKLFHPFGWV